MSSEKLYSPLKVGAITAANRIFMAPLTRLRSIEPGDIPTPLMAEYYRQRASAGLIISEATQISAQAKGYAGAPGIHSPEQIAAWKKITAGVHAENGHMAVQLWHTGRISHASLQPGGQAPVAPSALSAEHVLLCAMKMVRRSVLKHPCRVRLNWKRFQVLSMISVRPLLTRVKPVLIW